MNKAISRLFLLLVALFAVLVYFTSKSTVFDAQLLRANDLNKRGLLAAQKVPRGRIVDAQANVLASSRRDNDGVYTRRYPSDAIFSQTVGYSFITVGQSGLESYYQDQLSGRRGELRSVIDQLRGEKQRGEELQTGLDAQAQRAALDGLAGRRGAVVAMNPQTGQVQVMASTPGFNQNEMASAAGQRRLDRAEGSPIVNRVTQGTYPPGSTFKVVTAIAALDSGRFTPSSRVDGDSGLEVSGVPLANDEGTDWGEVDLTTALSYSINTAWANVALELGPAVMDRYMKRLGFGQDPPIDLPADQIASSGEYMNEGRTLVSAGDSRVDLGRMAIGQDKLLVTPLQMAMVAAAVANGGELMKPHIASRVVDWEGRVRETIQPQQQARVMSTKTAAQLGAMMSKVVNDQGTGTAAAIPGLEVAGKTGTAQIDIDNEITQPWFIAFAPVQNPTVAIAVTVERSQGGFGGTVAAPIAKSVMEALLK
jgi:peptidoglycan glycosyltransferase